MRYSIQLRDRIFAHSLGFYLLLTIWVKVLAKKYVIPRVKYTVKNFSIIPNNLTQMPVKLSQKE